MKYSHLFPIICSILLFACKSEKKQEKADLVKELSLVEKVAYKSGFENWKKVNELQFTFNVDRDTSHFERTWIWEVNKNQITSITAEDTITYNRSKMDSVAMKTNGGFINDKYWLMAPFNLIWDEGNYTFSHQEEEIAPLSKKPMHKLTIVYGSEGGYTPGDAYDFYFEEDYLIKEWVFRKGNQPEASLVTTWEDYAEINGLTIAKMHKNDEGFKLYFTNIEVKTN
ncbi:MAG: hypothetical protein HKN53_02875 [Maribacter sp.]|nr:hypothetical protein [Maribacter sp.]